ncbi:S8 family serine peptidase [Limibacter armeniacum]|uniref:S8 family serine peptidase n=1 Tax=Limibacter armeniacum TaxID=466084 RepID=UPI002FE5BDFF
MKAFEAWEITAGTPNVIVAVVDGGIDTAHEDLKDNLWVNEAEVNGVEGIDDDGNGFVDDIHGYNFVYDQGGIMPHYHGTHVAGTVGAVNNNGRGVSGVAGGTGNGDGVRLMSTQVFTDAYGGGFAAAIVYGANNGAVISQNSWGYTSAGYYEQEVLDAIDYFIEEAGNYTGSPMKGGVVIFASGNDDTDATMYPGEYPRTIAVASTQHDNDKAYYSNFGEYIDISAPGGDSANDYFGGVLSTFPGQGYGFLQGTSMACPHVSGVAALVVSRFGGENFTAEELRNRLVYSADRHTDALNDYYEGKMGYGTLNAVKALREQINIFPAQVTPYVAGFDYSDTRQTFAIVEWDTPADEGNGKPAYYEVFRAVEPFTAETLYEANQVIAYPASDTASTASYELYGPLGGKRYIAIRPVDMFGNKGAVSEILTVSYPAKPAGEVSANLISMNVDINATSAANTSFQLGNTVVGTTLKWDSHITHLSAGSAAATLSYPAPANVAEHGAAEIQYFTKEALGIADGENIQPASEEAVPYVSSQSDFFDDLGYDIKGDVVDGYLGVNNPYYSLGTATRFMVPDDKPFFTFSHLQFYFSDNGYDQPIILEIRKGGDTPAESKLLFAQEVHDDRQGGVSRMVSLEQHLTFKAGDVFWAKLIYPAEFNSPIVINEMSKSQAGRFFLSLDAGQTFDPMEYAMGVDFLALKVRAYSAGKGWDMPFMVLDPEMGEVEGGDTQTINLALEAGQLRNGLHTSEVKIKTNDKTFTIPVEFTVTGQEAKIEANKNTVEFGNSFIGEQALQQVAFLNSGLADLTISGVTFSSAKFSTKDLAGTVIKPGHHLKVNIAYSPDSAAMDAATMALATDAGDMEIPVVGSAIEKPVLTVTNGPADMMINFGDTVLTSMTIRNDGAYPLSYKLPQTIKDVTIGIEGQKDQGFGYHYLTSDNEGGPTRGLWEEISETGQDITSTLLADSRKRTSMDMGHEFNYYGEVYNQLYVHENGIVAFIDPSTASSVTGWVYYYAPAAGIGPFWHNLDLTKGGQVFYETHEDRTIVQWQNVPTYYTGRPGDMTFQLVLFKDGAVQFRYKDISGSSFLDWGSSIGFQNAAKDDGIRIGYLDKTLLKDNMVIEILPPAFDIVKEASAQEGSLMPGDSTTVDFVLDPSIKPYYGGTHPVGLVVNSNDPTAKRYVHAFNMNVIGEAMPKISADSLHFSTLMVGDKEIKALEIMNEGTQAMTLENVVISSSEFTETFYTTQVIEPKKSYEINITYRPETVAELNETITLTIDGSDIVVPIMAKAIDAPVADFSEISASIDLNYGDSTDWSFTVSNMATEGDTELHYTVSAPTEGSFLSNKALPAYEGQDKDFGYYFMDSRTSVDPADAYDWVDIRETGTQLYIEGQFAWSLVIPFDFPYYGESFNKLFVASDGFIGLDFPTNQFPFYYRDIPEKGDYVKGMIAPFWANFDPDYSKDGGVFYQMEEDRFIVTWENVIMHYRYDGEFYCTFQVILYKDGRIKYNYKDIDTHHDVAVIGLESFDETMGLSIKKAYEPEYVNEDLTSYTIYPPAHNVQANGEAETFSFKVDAGTLYEGAYTEHFYVKSNDPKSKSKTISVRLNITGTHGATIADSIAFGNAFMEEGLAVKEYMQDLTVENTGTKEIAIKGFHFSEGVYKNTANGLELLRDSGYSFSYGLNADKDFSYSYQRLRIAPGESYTFQVSYEPNTMGVLNDTLYLRMDGGTETIIEAIPVSANVTAPSMIEADIAAVSLNVLPTEQNEGDFSFSNAGEGILEYNFKPTWYRAVEEGAMATNAMRMADVTEFTADAKSFIQAAPSSAVATMATAAEAEMMSFTDSIHYADDLGPEEKAYRSGLHGTQVFNATRYKAGEAGFALTHFRNYVYNEGLPEASLKVQVRVGGTTPNEATIVHTQEFEVMGTEKGAWQLYEFDHTTFVNPNEYFFIVLEYDERLDYPQGVYDMGYNADNGEFFYSDNGGQSYKVTGLGIQRRIRVLSDASFDWLTLTPESGELSGSSKGMFTWNTDAAKAIPGHNSARVLVINNDPHATDSVAFNVDMYVNRAPYFTNPVMVDTVFENTPATIELMIRDYEGEALQVSLAEDNGFASIDWNAETGMATINVAADYEAAGDYTLTVVAADANGLQTSHEVMMHVVDVNRLPEITMENISFPFWSEYVIDQSLFTDGDGDALDIDATINTGDTVAQVVMRGNEMVILPFAQGTTTLNLMATDNRGDMVSKSVEITVSGNNAPEVANLIDEQSVFLEDKTFAVDFSDVFMDADGHVLAYTVSVSDSSAVDFVQTVDNRIIFTLNEATQVEVSITANDGYTSTSTHFMLTVNLPLAIDEELAAQIGLSNYPNPVSTSTTFSYSLVKGGNVAIEVTNLQGMVVKTIEVGDQSVGEYKSELQADALPAGMYIYSLKLNGKVVSTGKMIKR